MLNTELSAFLNLSEIDHDFNKNNYKTFRM